MADTTANRRSLISRAAKVFALLSGIGTTVAVLTSFIATILANGSNVFSFLSRENMVWSLSLLAMVLTIGVELLPGVWKEIKNALKKKGLFVSHD
jgi:hypothetical protein